MDLFILDNIIENDNNEKLEQILMDKFGYNKKCLPEYNKMFGEIEDIFNVKNSINYHKIKEVCNNCYDGYYLASSYNVDIFNYILAYKNIKKINICNKIIDLLSDIYTKNSDFKSCIYSLKKNLMIICSGPYPNYIFKKFNIDISSENNDYSTNLKLEQKKLLKLALKNKNLPIVLELCKETCIYSAFSLLTQEESDGVFLYINHNYQKNLKNLIKRNTLVDSYQYSYVNVLLKITKSLLINEQYGLLRTFYLENNLGEYKNSYYLGYIYASELWYDRMKRWISNKNIHLNCNQWFKLLDSVWDTSSGYKYHPDIYRMYNIILDYCPCKEEVLTIQNNEQRMTILDKIAVIPGARKLFIKYDKYVNYDELENNSFNEGNAWSPLLNSARYGDFHTFRYLYDKCNRMQQTRDPSIDNTIFDVLSSSFHNTDERIYKFILNEISSENTVVDWNYKNLLLSNIESCINGIMSKYIPFKYKKKRLLALNSVFSIQEYLERSINIISCNQHELFIPFIEWIIENFSIQGISVKNIYEYLVEKQEKESGNKTISYDNNMIEIIQNIIIKGYDIFQLFSYSLSNNDWFEKINQNILIFLPDLSKLSITNQSWILTGLIKRWESYFDYSYKNKNNSMLYYCSDSQESIQKVDEVLTLLLENNFNFEKIKIKNNRYPYYDNTKIINHILSQYNYKYAYSIMNHFVRKGLFLKCIDLKKVQHNGYYKIKEIVIVLRFLNRCVINKNVKNKKSFNKKYKPLLNDLLNHPGMKDNILRNGGMEWRKAMVEFGSNFKTNYNHPQHLNPINLQSLLKNNDLVISEKADGIKKCNITHDVYPYLNVELKNIEAEYISDLDIYLIFNTCDIQCSVENVTNKKITPYFKNKWLREIHPFTSMLDSDENFSLTNLERERENFRNFLNYERNLKKNNKTLWYPKKVWKINKNNLIEILRSIENQHVNCPFPSDGWVITPSRGHIVKIKPFEHLTVDLYQKDKQWLTRDNKMIEVLSHNDKEGVWRCYWNDKHNVWESKELREEKKFPNDSTIESFLSFQNKNKWKIYDKCENQKTYYQKTNIKLDNNTKKFLESQHKIHKYLSDNIRGKCLDIGCGDAKYLKTAKYEYWLGIDTDLNKLSEICDRKHQNCNILHFDISKDWSTESQKRIYPFQSYQNYDILLNNKFDNIIINFAINYGIQENGVQYFVKCINNLSKNNTNLYVNFLDADLLIKDKKFEKKEKIYFEKSYIKKIDNEYVEIYFDWVHKKPLKEKLLSSKLLITEMQKLGWISLKYYEIQNVQNCWNKYQNYLTYIKFIKK